MGTDPRWGRLMRALAVLVPGAFCLFSLILWGISGDLGFALISGALLSLSSASFAGTVARVVWTPRPAPAWQLGLIVVLGGLLAGLTAALLLTAFGVPAGWAAGGGAVFGAAAGAVNSRSGFTAQLRGLQDQFPLSIDNRKDAERALRGTRRHVPPTRFLPGGGAAQRAARQDAHDANAPLNKARARVFLATSEADYDKLPPAVRELRDALANAAFDPALTVLAASDLVTAESMLAQRSRDRTRYAAAVDLFARLAREHPEFGWASAKTHEFLADYQLFELMLAAEDFASAGLARDEDAAAQALDRMADHHHTAEHELREAIARTDDKAEILPQYKYQLGVLLCSSLPVTGEDRTDDGISLIRDALGPEQARKGDLRNDMRLSLSMALIERYHQRAEDDVPAGATGERDLDEAFTLLLRLVRQPNPMKARVWRLMLELVAASRRNRPVTVPRAAREAFAAAAADATMDLIPIARMFVDWTESADAPAGLRAEAYSMALAAMERDATRRELPAESLRLLGESQDAGASAGFWLAAAHRERDAAAAVDQSRGILLGRLIGGIDPAVSGRLRAAGRADLVTAYLDALRARAEAYRGRLGENGADGNGADGNVNGAGDEARGILRDGTLYPAGILSPLEAAHAELTRLNREITAATGLAAVTGTAGYADIERVARAAPVVYLGAASDHGFALIVREGREPAFLQLTAMTREALSGHVDALRRPKPSGDQVRACVDWLATTALQGLTSEIDGDQEIALIPLGALNALPVNGALIQATRDRADGPVAVRHLPSARAAAQAAAQQAATQQAATQQAAAPQPAAPWPGIRAGQAAMLVIDAATSPGRDDLKLAKNEAALMASLHGATRLADCTVAAALDALPGAEIVQFLCHGEADLANPLAGGLALADGMLTVQQLFTRPPAGRQLVIVSACESHLAGTAAPDEIVGLPVALYQAGASGIIAAQWEVEERAAALVLRRFHELRSDGATPVRALTTAQHWLSAATHDELSEKYPDLFRYYRPGRAAASRPYAGPLYWSAFSYTGI